MSRKRNKLLIQYEWTSKHYTKWKNSDMRGQILYNSIYMTCSERANLELESRLATCLGLRVGVNCKWVGRIVPRWWKCLKTDLWWWLHNSVICTNHCYTSNAWILWYVKYVIKVIFFNYKDGPYCNVVETNWWAPHGLTALSC